MTRKKDKTRRSNKGMRPLGYALKPITTKVLGKKSSLFGKLVTEWNTIMDGNICQSASPVKLSFPRGSNGNATLTLAVTSSQAVTMQHSTDQILQRLNQFFGYQAVQKISFIHKNLKSNSKDFKLKKKPLNPAQIEKIENDLDFVDDDEMKKALVALGKSVIHKG